MKEHSDKFESVIRRVTYMNILMQLVMVLRLVMIWSQNTFWYMPNQTGWLTFVVVYQLLAALVPIAVFIFVSFEQVLSAFKERWALYAKLDALAPSNDFESREEEPDQV